MVLNSQVGAPVRRCEEPSPGPPSCSRCFCSSETHWLDVCGRRVTGYPTSVDRRDVGAAPWSPDQGRSSLILFIAVVDDPHEPAAFWGLAGRALPHQRIYSRPRWVCFRGGWLHSHWPLLCHSVLDGRCWSALVFIAAGVLEAPSNIAWRRVHPNGMVHTRC